MIQIKPKDQIRSNKPLKLLYLHRSVGGGYQSFLSVTEDFLRRVITNPLEDKSESNVLIHFQKSERFLNN